ncbi:hypothetical protein CFBP6626_22025 [Agrobacterium tumefaciens]|nr:hypothetical protein CFBP6626_22025 [Agrobacterium tumefaciens]QCM13183.1 hypothetical protein CFBP6625_22860 [Agrobacterium tumefaciens]
MRQAACSWLFATFPSSVIPALSRDPQPARVCATGRALSAQGLGLAGCRIKSGMTDVHVVQKNRHETSVCPHSIPLLPFSRPPLFEKIAARRSGMASGSPEVRLR